MAEEKSYRGLRRFNAVMGVLHLVQGVFMWVVSNDTTFPVVTNFFSFDRATMSLAPSAKTVYELPFGPAIAIFLLLSAVAHLALATFGYKWYVKNLKLGMNPARFYEYALSSSLMVALIGMLVGVWDLGALILMFGINATMNLFGIMMELHNQHTKRTNWTSFIYGV
ncbi:MAG TPA: heliorhodopsin HeR, partial [Anaerolineae bacterium]|nr:heliorhodopsin HeR [Anaerolineae bacterium]